MTEIIPITEIILDAQGEYVDAAYAGSLFEDGKWYSVTIDSYTERAIAYENGTKVTIAASDGTNTVFISTETGSFDVSCVALASTTIHILVNELATPSFDFQTSHVYLPGENHNQSIAFRLIHKFQLFIFKLLGIFICKSLATLKSISSLERYPNFVILLSSHKIYEWIEDSIATADDIDVIQPTHILTGEKGRWVKVEVLGGGAIAASQADWNETDPLETSYIQNKPTIPTDTGDLTNGAGFITDNDITIPTLISELTDDVGIVVDPNYVATANDYTTVEKNKLSGIEAQAEVNDIDSITVNGVAVTVTNKVAAIAAITEIQVNSVPIDPVAGVVDIPKVDGDSAYEVYVSNVPQGQTPLTESAWLASLQGTNGAKWHDTAVALVVGSDVVVGDLTLFAVNDYVISTDNNVYGKIKSIAGTDAVVTGLAQGGATGQTGADGTVTFFGTDVTGIGTGFSATVVGSKTGDTYKNTTTGGYYLATAPNTWDYKGSDKGDDGVQGVPGVPGAQGAPGADGVDGADGTVLSSWANAVKTLDNNDFLPCFKADGTPSRITVADLKILINVS